jgi:8-amino-7-oxononanoate synthase
MSEAHSGSPLAIETRLKTQLDALAAQGLQRRRPLLETPCGPHAVVEGQPLLAFASNDYLGLANDPALIAALQDGAGTWGAGSGASHLVSGHLQPHQALEDALAAFLGFPRALTFSTGYLANLAILPALTGRGDAVFADKLNHASLIDGVQLCRADSYRYPHNDMAALERQLAASTAPTKVIVSDAVFSMDGDLAPLAELLALAEHFDTWLVLDDAHGFGVLGAQGRGSLAHCGLAYHPRILLIGTLGKAAGVGGAFIAGSNTAIEWLIQTARSYIFTTAAPPAIACTLQASLKAIAAAEDRRQHLQTLITHLRQQLADLPWQLLHSETAIQPLIIGDNQAALEVSQGLLEQGIWVPAIRPPTVPKGTARLRISLSAAHQLADIERLSQALNQLAA